MKIYNKDCLLALEDFKKESVDLMICDPPFGIEESKFDKHYKRDNKIIEGYQEAPKNYYKFSKDWISVAKDLLKKNGSMYIISGWSNSDIIGRSIRELDLFVINKIIWQFDFGVNTKNKFVTSHYEIYYISHKKNSFVTFNSYCRYGSQEKDINGNSLLYKDKKSVWEINKEYQPGKEKNQNKLPENLIRKMIMYSSNKDDIVCDLFLGNFTTAIVAKKTHRVPTGYEINKKMFDIGIKKLNETQTEDLIEVNNIIPKNQGKTITQEEIQEICDYYKKENKIKTRKEITEILMKKYGRGPFSIKNIIDEYCDKCSRKKKDINIEIVNFDILNNILNNDKK